MPERPRPERRKLCDASTWLPRQRINATLLEECLERHGTLLQRTAERHAGSAADAEDALQDAMEHFLQHFDPERFAEPLPWLITTLKRQAWALTRRSSRDMHLDEPLGADSQGFSLGDCLKDDGPGPIEGAIRDERLAVQRVLLRGLKRDERRALFLWALGFSYREAAEALGWTYTKVNRCVTEGRAALRKQQGQQ